MKERSKLSGPNQRIQEMLSSSEIKNFYRFVAQNPHLTLREACQIIIKREDATVCFSFEEWNAMGRRVNKGSAGIPYVDEGGRRGFAFDASDTHGDGRYKRPIYPLKRLLKGLAVLNGTEKSVTESRDYYKILAGVATYLNGNDYFADDEERNRLLAEGVAYYLYCKTGFPKNNGIDLSGLPYDLRENADFFMNVKEIADNLQKEVEEAYLDDLNKVETIDDTEEENVSDEPILPSRTETIEETEPKENPIVSEHPLNPIYEQYMKMEKKYPNAVVLYRLGDFYEIFGEKAKTIGEELDLTITGRDFGLNERVPMVGFPYHVTDAYISKIVEKYGVVLLEPDAEPKYILSHEEAMAFNSEQEKPKRPALEELSPEESAELDRVFGERTDEEDTEITDEDWEEAEKYLYGDEEVEESEQEETIIQPQKEKTARTRRKKEKPQLSLFDLLGAGEEKEETYEDKKEKFIKEILTRGSGVSHGKFRIVENYDINAPLKDYAKFLQEEYGYGGFGGPDGIHESHDGKGIRARFEDKDNPENNVDFDLNWLKVAAYIADYIDDNEYFTPEEKEEYKLYRAERYGSDEERIKAIAENTLNNLWNIQDNGYFLVWGSDHYAGNKYINDHAAEIIEEIKKKPLVDDAYYDTDFYSGAEFFICGQNLKHRRELKGEKPKTEQVSSIIYDTPKGEQPIAENTDLTEIGFDQSELGGLKARFQANIEAIRLLNALYNEDRLPTKSEQLMLAKYVGWGGLAKAFDERDDSWQKEYSELKAVLSPEDYEKAKASVLNAHYTSKEVIQGIYSALARMGVKGNNRILEPAMGTGNFFGYMPKEIEENARLYGVELDTITGKLAQKLYPNANIQIKGFEQTSFSNNRFDIVVGNVPFGAYTVYDSDYAKQNFYIHDYFLAKSIDKLKPNGLMAVITSSGTMDKLNPSVRKYLAERAELLGAIRLPNTAFKQNAGTEVVADILFFRKRENLAYVHTDNTEWLATGKTEEGYEINNYFIQHPEMVLGTLTEEHGLYGALDVTVKPDGRTITEALNEAIGHLPKDVYLNPTHTEEIQDEISVDYNIKPLCYKAENGKLFLRVGDEMVEQEIPKSPKDAYERICEMITLRNELRYVLEIQTEGCSEEKLQSEQRILNANYDHFVKRFGYLNSQTNTRLFRDDADSALLFACEDVSEDKLTVTKAEIFSKRTIRPYVAVSSTDDCFEALQISKNERGQVDISYIEELTGKDYDTVLKELDTAVFRVPSAYEPEDKYTGFVTAEEYLSGNVVKKLIAAKRYAEDQDKAFEKNVKALEAVQPTPIPASDIGVRIGASWIDKEYYKAFLYHLLELPTYYDDGIEIYYNHFDSSWRVDKKGYFRYWSQENANEVYGTSRANAYRLFEDCLNLRATTIYDTVENSDGSTKRVLNQAETIAAREKQNKIKEAFVDWIFSDPERREQLEKTYNSTFNQTRLPTYDGSYLRFPGMNPAIELKPHQKDAVHRIVSTGKNTLLHHVVGSGKTFTMFAAGMKLRQYGLAKKIMYAVPNHLVEQWAAEGRKLYPNAKILVATKEDLAKDKRQRFVSKVAMGDWDAIIIAQSSFAKIPISPERQIRKIQEEIQRIEETIEATWMDKGMPRGAVKNLEKIKKNREAQLKKLLDDDKKDNVLIFENLGVDYLFIDEAHYYKNKFLFTKMNNVAGISTTASQRASDLELKVEYINELHGGDKGVVFATGTPISNSMTEMYTMQSYLQRNELANIGITFFDQWAANFGETVTSLEMAPSGQGYKARTRFSKFTNLPELLTMYRSFADVQTQDMVKLDVPDVDRKVITLKPSDTVLELADEIAKRAEDISKGGIPPEIDNMLKVTSDGKKLALDPRCFDRAASDENGSKINECASRIFEIWEDTTATKGTQIVFCDLSTPKKAFEDYECGKDFDVYNDLKYKLVQMGIPQEEIAFIHDANGDKAKQSLFDKVNAGAVRVLIGSTEKCGAGTNVQERLIALHHLDTPYRPSDMQQREGRIIRQGNTNKEVQIYTYVTERTFDSYSYQILENKQKFISQIDRGDLTVREAEDIDERTLNYAEIKAITAANPKIKRKMEVDTEIARLRVLEGQYKKNMFALQDKIRKTYPEDIKRQTLYLERLRADIATIKEKYNPEEFSINVQGKTYTDKKEGGQALMDALYHNSTETIVAEYGGMKISLDPLVMIASERSISLSGAGKYSMEIGQSASGLITRLDNFLEVFPEREARAENKLSQLQNDLKVAGSQVNRSFEHKDTLAALVKEQAELNAELDLNKREEVVIDEEKDDTVVSVDSDEVAMGVPESHYNRKERKKPRKHLNEQISKTYNKVKGEEPDAYVFLRNGSNYEIYGEQARELAEKYELPTITDTVSGQEEVVLSVDYRELDTLIRDVIGNGNKAKIIEETFEKEETFIDGEDQIAAMQVAVLPDYSIGQEEMHKYGYTWDGMLPLRKNAAKLLFEVGLPVKYLHGTDSEEAVDNTDDIVYRSGLFGIEKPEWQAFCESDKGFAYLYARSFFSESVLKTLNEDMGYIDGMYVDGLSDAVYEENAVLKAYLPDDKIPVDEQMKPFVKPLLDYFTARFEYFPLEYYGWTLKNATDSIAEKLSGEELKAEAQRILKGEDMEETSEKGATKLPKDFEKLDYRAYSNKQGYGLTDRETRLWINAYRDGTEEQRSWIINFFENINYHYETGLLLQEKYDELKDEYPSSLLDDSDEVGENSKEDGKYDYLLDGVDFDDQESVKLYFGYVRDWFLLHKGETNQSPVSYEEFMNNEMQDEEMRPIYENFAKNETIDSYDKAKEYLSDPFASPVDYGKEVMKSVEKEFDDFRDGLTREPALNVFHRNYEIHVKTELQDVINGGVDFDEETYKTLYQEKGHILQSLFDSLVWYTTNDKKDYNIESYDNAAEFIRAYCREQSKEEASGNIEETKNVREKVFESVKQEYDKFINAEKGKSKEDLINKDNYKIRFFNELRNFIEDESQDESTYVTDRDWEALNEDSPHIISLLYDYYLDNEYVSINNYEATNDLIQFYNDKYHEEIVSDRNTYEAPKENLIYYGKDTGNAAYYRLIDGHLSRDSLSEITERADDYVIIAPALAMSQEDLEKNHIVFLKDGRDISIEGLNASKSIISNMQLAVRNVQHQRAEEYRRNMRGNVDCKQAIEAAISANFDGAYLKEGFENALIERFGLDRVKYVLSNTVQMKSDDGRFSATNKEWANGTEITEMQEHRYQFIVESHPAVLDGFINRVRNLEKQKSVNESINGDCLSKTKDGYAVVNITKDTDNRNIAIVYRPSVDDFVVAAKYDTHDGTWGQGIYVSTLDQAEKYRKEQYGDNPYVYENKDWEKSKKPLVQFAKWDEEQADGTYIARPLALNEETGELFSPVGAEYTDEHELDRDIEKLNQNGDVRYVEILKNDLLDIQKKIKKQEETELAENKETENKKKWITVLTAKDALIKKYAKSSLMRMPTTGEYAGYTYFLYNDRIREGYQTTDIQSDSRELAYSLRIGEDETIRIENRETGEMVELSAEEFKDAVGGTTSEDYVRYNENGEKRWTGISVPSVAMRGTYDKSTLFVMPNNAEIKGSFYVPNSFVSEDTDSEEGRLRISVPDDFTFTVKNKETEKSEKLSAYQLFRAINGTKESDYEREKTEEKNVQPQEKKNDNGWKYVSVPNAAFITEYEKSDMFRMPKGEYEGYCFFLPHELFFYNEEKDTIRISLPETFTLTLNNRNAKQKEERKIEMTAEDFVSQVKGKKAEDYRQYQKPGEMKTDKFSENEKKLRENVPEEMKKRPNWVIVRTKENPDTGRLEKYLIDVHTGKFAESDNPETWTDFDTACEYAKENGGVALAYALDGKDGICCIDLDHCYDENGKISELAASLVFDSGDSYTEKSISGQGIHIFGKTKGVDVRAFSKDGKSEFYQKSHFITMTGDVLYNNKLNNFDDLPVIDYICEKHEKRSEPQGKGKGVEGLSRMSDRDVVDKAISSKGGDTFKALYSGQDLQNNHSNSDMSLMNRLAFWCNGDKEQMLRIFATSGLFRENKSSDYYECTAIKAIRDTTDRFRPKAQNPVSNKPFNNSDKGGK